MKPFFILITCFTIGCSLEYLVQGHTNIAAGGRIALTVMLFSTAFGHFKFKNGMALMLPSFVPAKTFIITATGVLEIILAILIQIPILQCIAGWLLIAMFVLFLPANVYAASRHLNYETGTYDGKGLSYLWFRIPFQLLLIGWTWFFVIHPTL